MIIDEIGSFDAEFLEPGARFGKDNHHGRLWVKRSRNADFHNPRRWPSQIYTTGVPICRKGATSYQN